MLYERLKALRPLRVTDTSIMLKVVGVVDKSYSAHRGIEIEALKKPIAQLKGQSVESDLTGPSAMYARQTRMRATKTLQSRELQAGKRRTFLVLSSGSAGHQSATSTDSPLRLP